MWLAMAMTFNDLYQGLTEDDVPPLTKMNNANAPAPNNNDTTDLGPLFMKDDDPQLDEFRNLFSTPFNCGFRRVVDINRAGNMTISYGSPDKVTRLESREAMERFLDQNPTLDIPTLDFCWANLILGFKDPAWETICVQDPR